MESGQVASILFYMQKCHSRVLYFKSWVTKSALRRMGFLIIGSSTSCTGDNDIWLIFLYINKPSDRLPKYICLSPLTTKGAGYDKFSYRRLLCRRLGRSDESHSIEFLWLNGSPELRSQITSTILFLELACNSGSGRLNYLDTLFSSLEKWSANFPWLHVLLRVKVYSGVLCYKTHKRSIRCYYYNCYHRI